MGREDERGFRLAPCAAAGALAIVALAPAGASADDDAAPPVAIGGGSPFTPLDTKDLFGFLEGADVGEKGDRSIELETTGSFGKPQGLYGSVEQEFIFENTLTDSLGLELGARMLGQDVKGVPDLPDFQGVSFLGLSVELRYVLLHRTAERPIQITATVQPEWNSFGDAGRRANDFAATFRAIADVVSPDRRLYGAVNVVYAPDGGRILGQAWQQSAVLGASAALSWRLTPPFMLGLEADYDRAYAGFGLQSFSGQAVYVGPTLHYQINDKVDLSAAFLAQATSGRLDLDDFPRQMAKLRLEIDF